MAQTVKSNGYLPYIMHPVIHLPEDYWVFDFTKGPDPEFECPFAYQIGRYDEYRPGMYLAEIFEGDRDLHIGIDIGAPIGEPVHSFMEGEIYSFGINGEAGSYGPTIIVKYLYEKNDLWALYGHLSLESLDGLSVGMKVKEGQILGTLGDKSVNGGWNPHVHLQLSWQEPEGYDMPGVVARSDREWALKTYPDPRMVLGPIY
jgi:peptidoglycan LD-endopeptidase LytH